MAFQFGTHDNCPTAARHSFATYTGTFGCLGKPLALRQLAVVFGHLLLAYKFSFASGFDEKAFLDGWSNMRTNVLGYPLMVTVETRAH